MAASYGTKAANALAPKTANALLDKLATDNEFRRLFKQDPLAALKKVGYQPSADSTLHVCCQVSNIAPKALIGRAREELLGAMVAGLGQQPIQLNAPAANLRSRK